MGADTSDNVVLSTVDEYGTAVTSYTWNDWASDAPCWVDDEFAPIEGVALVAGQAFWTSGSASDQGVQSAGEVGLKDVIVNLRFGYTLTGNPFPVAISLQDIVAEGEDTSDNVVLAKIDEYGTATESYAWCDWAADEPCWVDDSFAMVEGVTIAPGEGLWTSGSSDAQSVRFPAPEL